MRDAELPTDMAWSKAEANNVLKSDQISMGANKKMPYSTHYTKLK